jgi:hypothetical protein
MLPRSVIDDSRSIIDESRVMLQLLVSLTIVIYNCHIFMVQANGVPYENPLQS